VPTKTSLSKDKVIEALDLIADTLESWDDENIWSLREDYSGRWMYGETCFGIVTGNPQVITLLFIELAANAVETNQGDFGAADWVRELAFSMKTDNMAMDMIYYFPGWELV
jgi:hypothetical protein